MADYSINAVTRKVVYTGSAGLGPYSFSFEVLVNTDIAVYFNTTLLTLTTDYSVTINANGTGSLTIVTGTGVPSTPTGSDTITIVGARDIERTTDFSVGGDLSAAALNEQLDAEIIFIQQIDERVDRSIKAAVTDPTTINMELPVIATRANKLLAFDADGDVTVSTETVSQIEGAATSATAADASATAAAASAAAAAASETAAGVSEAAAASYASPVTETFADTVGFTAGTSTTITLAATVVEDAVIITFDGVTQHHDTYSISGTTVTFTSTIPVGVLAIEASYGTRSTGAIDNIIIGANTPAAGSFTTVNGVTPATAQYTTTLDTKLGGIEALADVTDATNVTAAGALMDSELTSIASVKALNQGVATTDTPTFAGIITSGNVDGRDVSVDGTKLDGIEAAADVTDATNVTAAGALMDSELTDIAAVKALDQGVATTDSPTFAALTASGDAIVDNLGTGGISPVRDLHVSNAGTNVFAQWTNNTTGHTTTDGWLSGMPNGTDFRYYGYEVGGVFTVYPEETLSLTVAKLGVTVAGTLSAGATTVTTLTASGDVAINTDTLLVDVSTETIGVKMTPDVLGAPLQIKHDGTVAYLGLDGGNSDTAPFLSTWQDPDPASALFGWSFFNRSTDGNLRLSRRNNSTTDTEVLTIARSDGAATFAGTLSAGATTVAGLTSSGHITVGAALGMRSSEADQLTYVSGGSSINDGANMLLYGQSHGTQAYDITFRGNVGVVLQYDESAAKWDFQAKTLQTTAGVYIGGTAAANLLDDYEEGTFTPTLTGASTPGTGQAYTTQQGNYTKIGNVVNFNINLDLSSVGTAAGTLQIEGLPFTAADTAGSQQAAVIGNLDHIDLTAGKTWAAPLIIDNAAYLIILEHGDAAAGAGIAVSQFGGSLAISISGSYIAA
jgi:hypothetical protein